MNRELIEKYPSTFIAEQKGNFFKCHGDNAYILHNLLGYKLEKFKNGAVYAGFPLNYPEKTLNKLEEKHISYKFFKDGIIFAEKEFEDNKYEEFRTLYHGVGEPEKKKQIQSTAIIEGFGSTTALALEDMGSRIEKEFIVKGYNIEALSTVKEERNMAVKVTGIVIYK